MKRTWSLQRRISVGLAIAVTIMWLAATLAAGFAVRHELDEAFDSALQETAQRLLSLAAIGILGQEGTPAAQRVTALADHEEFLTYLVRDKSGNVLLQSHGADPAVFSDNPSQGFRNTTTHRLYGEATKDGTLFIEVAEPLEQRREATIEAAISLFTPLPVLIPLSLLGVWWFVRRAMRPMLDLKVQIEVRGGGDLSPVAAEDLPTEIGPIADAVNQLMERLRQALEAERSFTANSAHELRTPIAAALAQTQRLIAETPDGPINDRARQIEASLHRLTRLSEKLMQLARVEGGGLITETPQDMALVLPHVVDELRQDPASGSRIKLTTPVSYEMWFPIDPDAFAILMRNLIENALKHGKPGTPVDVIVTDDGATRVINDGPVLPPETLAKLKGRFEQGMTDANGAGLGLAIADAIAVSAGAKLDLLSPASNRADGFEAVLYLPQMTTRHDRA